MSDAGRPAEGIADVLKKIESLEKQLRVMRRQSDRPKRPSMGLPFGLPSMPPPNAMGAAGPMMAAWLLSWLYANPRTQPDMLELMARFAASREDFWHHSYDALAVMAGEASDDEDCEPAISADDKKKIKAALEAQKLDQQVIDCVFHAMNLLDYFQQYRNRKTHGSR